VRCQDDSWARKAEREGKKAGSLAAAGLFVGRVQAFLRASRRLLYLQWVIMRGRQASRDRMEVGVEEKALVVHLGTLCQQLFMPQRALNLAV